MEVEEESTRNDESGGSKMSRTALASPDSLMEYGITHLVRIFLNEGGNPGEVIKLFAQNYKGYAQMCNLVMKWLMLVGVPQAECDHIVVRALRDMCSKDERKMFEKLKVCRKHLEEESKTKAYILPSLSVFTKELIELLDKLLSGKVVTKTEYDETLEKICALACQSEQPFLLVIRILVVLQNHREGDLRIANILECLRRKAKEQGYRFQEVYSLGTGVISFEVLKVALRELVRNESITTADVEKLTEFCKSLKGRPSARSFRWSEMIFYLLDQTFLYQKQIKLTPKVLQCYHRLLAILSTEGTSEKNRTDTLVKAIAECSEVTRSKVSFTQLYSKKHVLYRHVDEPLIACGILKWIKSTVSSMSFYEASHLHTTASFFFNIIGIIAEIHPLLQDDVFETLWSSLSATLPEGFKAVTMMELHSKIVTVHFLQLVHLGLYETVFNRIAAQKTTIDRSLLRKFVSKVVHTVIEPYPSDFVKSFTTLLESPSCKEAWSSTDETNNQIMGWLEKKDLGLLEAVED